MATKKDIEPQKTQRDSIGTVLYGLYLLFLLLSVVVLVRIAYLQLFYKPDPAIAAWFKPKSEKIVLEPMRGAIIARDGRLLAMSTPMYQVYMDCTVMKNAFKDQPEKEEEWREKAKALAVGLSGIYGDKPWKDYYDLIIRSREAGKAYVRIGRRIDHETMKKVSALPLFCEGANRGGFLPRKFDSRQYPYGTLARRTIGYVKDNSKSDGNNMIGLEGRFDYVLHGKEGVEWMKVTDNRDRIHNYDSVYVRPEDGFDLRTTLDIDIQDIADQALRRQIEESPKVEGGCAIVMDVETGAIRAMVNLLRDSVSGRMNESYNMAIGRAGEPGSVFKSTTLMSLLEDGKVSLSDEIPTNHGAVKGFAIDNHIIDYERENHTNRISVLHGFEISSNYVFRRLAIDAYGSAPGKMIDRLYRYKLGEAFDFDLDGFQTPTIPSPSSPYWSNTDLGSVAIGYSVSITPLHTITFYNAIAGKGRMMKPYLVESIEENGIVREKRGPSVLNGSICSRATADTLTRALMRVTEEGTGKLQLGSARCQVAGKTGTARIAQAGGGYTNAKGQIQYQATFVGFFPAEAPKYTTIVVLYSNPGTGILYGGTLPAKAFREIVDKVYALDSKSGELLTEKGPMPKWN